MLLPLRLCLQRQALLFGNPDIVSTALLRVGQHRIRLVDDAHNAVRIGIVGVAVRVVLLRQGTVGGANHFVAGVGGDF